MRKFMLIPALLLSLSALTISCCGMLGTVLQILAVVMVVIGVVISILLYAFYKDFRKF